MTRSANPTSILLTRREAKPAGAIARPTAVKAAEQVKGQPPAKRGSFRERYDAARASEGPEPTREGSPERGAGSIPREQQAKSADGEASGAPPAQSLPDRRGADAEKPRADGEPEREAPRATEQTDAGPITPPPSEPEACAERGAGARADPPAQPEEPAPDAEQGGVPDPAGVIPSEGGAAAGSAGTLEGKAAALLGAPLTATNLAKLLATIDPRLVAAGLGASAPVIEHSSDQAALVCGADGGPDAGSRPADGPVPVPVSGQAPGVTGDSPPTTDSPATSEPGDQDRTPELQNMIAGPSKPERATDAKHAEPDVLPSPAIEPPPARVNSATGPAPAVNGEGVPALAGAQGRGGGAGVPTGTRGDARPSLAPRVLEAMTHEPPAGQLARGLAAALGRGTGGEVTMRLHPAALGHVKIAVAVDGRKANVRFTTGNAQARGLLSTSLGSLREALESRGLVIDRLSVEEPRGADPGRTEPTASAARTHAPGLTPREAHEAQGQGWPTLTPDGGQDSGGWTGGRDGSGRGARSAFEGAGTTRPAGTAGPSDEPPGGAVVLIKDGVQDPMGRIMLRLDALA